MNIRKHNIAALMVRVVVVMILTTSVHAQVGSCCYSDSGVAACVEETQEQCTSRGGIFLGIGTECVTTVCQVREWSIVLDDDVDTIILDRFDNIQQSRRLDTVASRINVTSSHLITLDVHPSRQQCLTSDQTRVDVRAFIDVDSPTISLFPSMAPLIIDSGFPWQPGPDAALYCGDPLAVPEEIVLCPIDQGGPLSCDYGGMFQYLGTDSFELLQGSNLSEFTFDGLDNFDVTVSGSGYFLQYASLTTFSNPINQADGAMILGYSYTILNGACCLPDGTCGIDTSPECIAKGGEYQGDFVSCITIDVCDGACCVPDVGCLVMSAVDCALSNGSFMGIGTNCESPNDCPGACCIEGGSCSMATEQQCEMQCGTFLGAGSSCGLACPFFSLGACCLPDGSCLTLCPVDCAAMGGDYQGTFSTCEEVVCMILDTCPADLDDNNTVNVFDLLLLLDAWGSCALPCPPPCLGDIATEVGVGSDCSVGVFDLLELLNGWGACP